MRLLGILAASVLAQAGVCAAATTIVFTGGKVPDYQVARAPGGMTITFEASELVQVVGEHQRTTIGGSKTRIIVPLGSQDFVTTQSRVDALTISEAGSTGAVTPPPSPPPTGAGKSTSPPQKLTKSAGTVAKELQDKGAEGATEKPDGTVEIKELLQNYSTNLAIPDSPGLSIVGIGSEEVARPTSPRALAIALAPTVDKDGQVKRGFALEFAPMKVFAPTTTKESYLNPIVRALWNTQISIGTAKPADDKDKSLKAGFGIQSVVYRPASSDPLLDPKHRECLQSVIASDLEGIKTQPAVGITQDKDEVPDKDAGKSPSAAKCYKALQDRTWNGSAISIALATSRYSETGNWGDGKQDAHGGWLSMAYGFESLRKDLPFTQNMQAVLAVRRLLKETVVDPLDDNAKVKQGSWLVGGKLLLRSDNFNYYVELAYKKIEIEGRERDKVRRGVLGLEWQVSPGMWIVAGVGGEGGRTNGKDTSFVTTGVKLGSATESVLPAK